MPTNEPVRGRPNHRRRSRTLWAAASTVLSVCMLVDVPSARGHDDPDHRIARLSAQISKTPGNGLLHLQRARLYELAHGWEAALVDANVALAISRRDQRAYPEAQFVRARVLAQRDESNAAMRAIECVIQQRPEWTDAWVFHAQLLARDGQIDAACDKMEYVLRVRREFLPDETLQLAQWYSEVDQLDHAITTIDRALAKSGSLPVLIDAAAEYEVRAGRTQDAIRRWVSLAQMSARPEQWLLRIAAVHESEGQLEDAAAALMKAHESIRSLPMRHQTTRTSQAMLLDIDQRLNVIEARATHE